LYVHGETDSIMTMSSKVLLTHSYYLHYDPKQVAKMKPYAPLGTLLSAAVLREHGHDVDFFDAMLARGVESFADRLADVRPVVVGILEDNFNFLTKMCTLRMREAARVMVRLARERGCRVMVNGSDAKDHPEAYLRAGADAVITGPVEPAVAELTALWMADPAATPDGVAGLALPPAGYAAGSELRGEDLRHTTLRPALQELDALPLPAWDLVDVERYRQAWCTAHGRFSWNMVASRGCPYGCNWCAKPLFGRRYAQRSPGAVARELRLLRERVAPDHVWFADDIFGMTARWIREFADEVTRLNARTPFMMQSRANLMTDATVSALRDAGAEEVWLGVESGSQRVLDAMDKGTTVEQVRAATRTLKRHGIRAAWFIQLGYLGEEWEDLLLTRDMIRAERPDDIGVSVSYPLPGTAFHDAVQQHLGAKRNWAHTGDLDMLFHGTYTADFYRTLRDLLHDESDARAAAADTATFDDAWAELARREESFRNPATAHA
jgi:anaerobic magnesium-protoporphyrin IX monomethyl ester cyclase